MTVTASHIDNIQGAIELLSQDPMVDLDALIVVTQSRKFPGILSFNPWDSTRRQEFFERYMDWLSLHMCLNEHYMFDPFVQELEDEGWVLLFDRSCKFILSDYERWRRPLEIAGFTCPKKGQLRPYQTFCLQRAFERNRAKKPIDRLTMPGWCAGAGKSLFACAGSQELFNRDEIDLVLTFALLRNRHNFAQFYTDTTTLHAEVPEGDKKRRQRAYRRARSLMEPDEAQAQLGVVDVFVLNYDKARFDFDELREITKGRRVLFVLDEVQKTLTHDEKNKARRGLDQLIQGCHSTVWPMTASIVGANPLRYHNLFDLSQRGPNPLGTVEEFEERYLLKDGFGRPSKTSRPCFNPKTKGTFTIVDYDWDLAALHEVRHRVADHVQNARKADPGIREYFPPLDVVPVKIQMSEEDRVLYTAVEYLATEARKAGENMARYYTAMRYIANTPEALQYSTSPVAKVLCEQYPSLITSKNCAKLEVFLDQVESIADAGDKVIAFSHWTNLGLMILHRELDKRKIRHTVHYGSGQSDKDSQKAQDDFKRNPDITLFLSSDAGAYSLNMQEARYCIQYEVPYSWDDYQQRINRIHRSDSELAGLTAYDYITEKSVEERVARVCEARRKLAEATLGTRETVEHVLAQRVGRSEESQHDWLIFGDDNDA